MTRTEEVIFEIEKLGNYDTEYILQALREKQEREKGCEYCTDLSKYKGFGYAEFFHQTAADECFEISIDVKYCPNCGRKLGGAK
jgi:hypothetical protein